MPIQLTRRRFSAAALPVLLRSAPTNRPNILLIVSDDHTAEFLGCYGNRAIRTPNVDRFASEGIRLTRMFVAAPQCVPSRAALLTGRSPVAIRMGRFTAPLPADVRTFVEDLRDAGYFTGVCGRTHHLDGTANGSLSQAIFKKYNLQTIPRRMDYVDVSNQEAVPARIREFFSRRPRGRPFFLWVNFNDPHHPWDRNAVAPPHDPAKIPVPGYLPDLPGVREDLARYYDEIARMDGLFQKVLDLVAALAPGEDTLTIFLGDNGLAFPHGKGTLYDPGLNVPCIVRWPGRIRPNSVSDALVSGEDLAPTILQAVGLKVPEIMSGRSFLDVLLGRSSGTREFVFAARLTHGARPLKEGTTTHTFDLSRMVRSARYKLIYNCTPYVRYHPVDSYTERSWLEITDEHYWGRLPAKFDRAYFGPRPVLEFYDLAEDPAELNNLAGRPEVAAEQRRHIEALQEKMILDWDFLPLPLNE